MSEAELRAIQSCQTALDEGTPSPEQEGEKICRQGLDNSGNIEALPTYERSVVPKICNQLMSILWVREKENNT